MPKKGAPSRPLAAPNGGIGKELPRDCCPCPIPAVPRNRRERRALAAVQRKQAKAATKAAARARTAAEGTR